MSARLIAGMFFAAAACLARCQADLAIYVDGKQVGTARMSQRITATGGKLVQLKMRLDSDATKATIYSESTYSSSGELDRRRQDMAVDGDPAKRHLTVTFTQAGATVIDEIGGKSSNKDIPLPADSSRADLSEFWFLRDQPHVGDTVTSSVFNVETLQWEVVRTIYKGERPIIVGGKRIMAHVTDSDKGTAYLDDTGLPLRVEMPGMVMERVWKTG